MHKIYLAMGLSKKYDYHYKYLKQHLKGTGAMKRLPESEVPSGQGGRRSIPLKFKM